MGKSSTQVIPSVTSATYSPGLTITKSPKIGLKTIPEGFIEKINGGTLNICRFSCYRLIIVPIIYSGPVATNRDDISSWLAEEIDRFSDLIKFRISLNSGKL